jgi:hypothetical protein
MDLYYDEGVRDLRREALRITAQNDEKAIAEAARIFGWRRPAKYKVRAIAKGARSGHRVVLSFTAPPSLAEITAKPENDQQ